MPEISIDVQGEGLKYIEGIAAKIRPETMSKLQKWLFRLEATAKKNASSKPGVDTGRLRSSITHEIRGQGDEILGIVGTNISYARFVEEGTRRHFVPFSVAPGLARWAARKGIDVSGKKGMMVSGKAQPFLGPAYDEHSDAIEKDFDRLPEDIAKG